MRNLVYFVATSVDGDIAGPDGDYAAFPAEGDHMEPGVRLFADDPVDEVRRLKKEPGADIWLCGGGALAAALAEEIDRLVLKVNPLVLGDGVPLFAGGHAPRRLELVDSLRFSSGVVVDEYGVVR